MDEFAGKVALITGAGRGAGRDIALAFSSLGVLVAANDINPLHLDETVNQIHQHGGHAQAYIFDIARRMPIEGMLAQVLDHFGRIDILINHASVRPEACLLDMDEWEFHRTLDVNLGGTFFCMQQVGRVMREHGGGSIINIISPIESGKTTTVAAVYLSSQAGLLGLTRAAAREFSVYNIRVNAVCAGAGIDNCLLSSPEWNNLTLHHWQESFPGLKHASYSDLVSLVLFLSSNAAASITGQVISVDEGS